MNLTRKAVVGWCLLACAAGAFPADPIGSLQPPVSPGEQQPLVPFEIRHAAGGAPGPLVSPDGKLTVKVVGDLEAQAVPVPRSWSPLGGWKDRAPLRTRKHLLSPPEPVSYQWEWRME
jgi:hypothetical protein